MQALYIAATGMAAQETNVNVISNNIANMRTTGYKRQRAEFQDLLYQEYRRAGGTTSDSGTQVPVGIEIGSGVRIAATPRVMSQGSVVASDKDLDIAVQGGQMLLVLLLAPLLTGFVRKVKARLTRRRGPSVFQPYRDLIRLLCKEVVLADSAALEVAPPFARMTLEPYDALVALAPGPTTIGR